MRGLEKASFGKEHLKWRMRKPRPRVDLLIYTVPGKATINPSFHVIFIQDPPVSLQREV